MHHDLDIDVIRTKPGEYRVRLRSAAAGEAAHSVRWPWRDLELENRLKDLQIALLRAGGKRRKALTPEEETVQRFGRELFDMLFAGEGLVLYRRSAERARQARVGLRIRLHLDDAVLAALPWEFLYDAAHDDYLCLSTQTPVLRYLDVGQPVAPLTVTAPLRVLGVVASPIDLEPPLDVDLERQRVATALAGLVDQGLVDLVWLEGQTWRDLQRALRRGPWHVVHFIGHGGFDPHRDEGVLWLEDDAGRARALHASELGRLLADHADLRLVLLNACESARPGALDIFSSTATALVRRGLPAVIAMQYAITDRAAIEFARSLYDALADGLSIDAAVSEARRAVQFDAPHSMEWGTPVLHLRAADGRLFELETPAPAPPVVEPSAQPAAQTRTPPTSPPAATPSEPVKTPAVVKRSLDLEVKRALAILTDWEHYPPEERLKAGDFLGAEPGRDPRPGVGLRSDGLPDIDWVKIPELNIVKQAQNTTFESILIALNVRPSRRKTQRRGEYIYQRYGKSNIPAFWIARYPITYLQFQAFVDVADGFQNKIWRQGLAEFPEWYERRPSFWNRPQDNVAWYHAVAYCRWLTARASNILPPELHGRKDAHITLPTELHWEIAARGWDGWLYPWGNEYRSGYANVDEMQRKVGPYCFLHTSAVGMYPQGASPFGVLDLSGNVSEWCLNMYLYPDRIQENGTISRALRGGSCLDTSEDANSYASEKGDPDRGIGFYRGFRVVCGASP